MQRWAHQGQDRRQPERAPHLLYLPYSPVSTTLHEQPMRTLLVLVLSALSLTSAAAQSDKAGAGNPAVTTNRMLWDLFTDASFIVGRPGTDRQVGPIWKDFSRWQKPATQRR